MAAVRRTYELFLSKHGSYVTLSTFPRESYVIKSLEDVILVCISNHEGDLGEFETVIVEALS